jgi:hypothetical protein
MHLKLALNLLGALIFKILLDHANHHVISLVFSAFSLEINYNSFKVIESYGLLFLVTFLVPRDSSKVSSTIIWLFIANTYIPALTVYGASNQSQHWIYAMTIFWIACFLCLKLFSHLEKITNYRLKDSRLIRISVISCVSTYTLMSILTASNYGLALNFVDIYDVRSNFAPVLPFAAYAISWSAFVINPLVVITASERKKMKIFILFVIFQIFIAAMTGQKVVLFSLPLIVGINWLWNKSWNGFFSICLGFAGLVGAGMLSWNFYDDVWISSLFASRMLIFPAVLGFQYYEFFSHNTPSYLSHSLFGLFLDYPYDDLPWYVIGRYYYNSDMSANAGMVADAYMNFRDIGLIVLALLFSMSLVLVDGFAKRHDPRLVMSGCIMTYYWSINGSFFSSIFTAGLGLALLFFFSLPQDKKGYKKLSINSTLTHQKK